MELLSRAAASAAWPASREPPTATAAEIKKAFFKLALKYHPDRNDADTTATMMKINAAYATLGDAQERLKYDALFACGVF